MNLKEYMATLGRGGAKEFAQSIGISPSFLSQLASGRAALSPARCVAIEAASSGLVSRPDLRPDDWRAIWPELEAVQPISTLGISTVEPGPQEQQRRRQSDQNPATSKGCHDE